MLSAHLPPFTYRRQVAFMAYVTWVILIGIIFFISPDFVKDVGWTESYLPFFLILLLTCFWSLWALTGRWKRSMLWSFVITFGIGLRTNQLDSWINLLLLYGFGIIWEYYWHETRKTQPV